MTTPHPTPDPQQRACPVCGTTFTCHPRTPNHTYCSHRCRNIAWHRAHPGRRHRRRQPAATASTPANPSSPTNAMANPNTNPVTTSTVNAVAATLPVNGAVNAVATTNGDATNAHANAVNHTQAANEAANEVVNEAANEVVNSVRHCPHCRQPIALITLVVPPAAAFVTVPTPPTKATLRPADTHPAGRPT